MKFSHLLGTAAVLAISTGAFASDNLVQNNTFARPGLASHTDFIGRDPNVLVDYAAAEQWLIWAGQVDGRVVTDRVTSELFGPGYFMLRVGVHNGPRIAGIDQVFLPVHTGPKHAAFCAIIKVVSGSVGLGANDEGNGTMTTAPISAGDRWVAVRGVNSTSPVNQIFIYAVTPDAEFYVQDVRLTVDPMQPKDCVVPNKLAYAPIETYVKPDPYPWTLHPEQNTPANLPAPTYGQALPAPTYGQALPAPTYGQALPAPTYGQATPAQSQSLPAPTYTPPADPKQNQQSQPGKQQ